MIGAIVYKILAKLYYLPEIFWAGTTMVLLISFLSIVSSIPIEKYCVKPEPELEPSKFLLAPASSNNLFYIWKSLN